MSAKSLNELSLPIMDVLIWVLPVGIFLGLGVVFFLRLGRYIWRRISEHPSSARDMVSGFGETVANVVTSASIPTTLLLIDAFLFLYLLFHYEWTPAYEQMKVWSPNLLILLVMPHILLMLLIKSIGPFALAASFFGLLGGCLVMSRFYVGPWPRRFQLSCAAIFTIVLAWLIYQWGQTGWNLTRAFPSDSPKGLQGMLVAALFSACSPQTYRTDAINSIGQSLGMSMLEWLAAIYLAEKYLRLAIFHKQRGELGFVRWIRFAPMMPALLVGAFVGYGIWGDIQHGLQIVSAEQIEQIILPPQHQHLVWHEAVEQCAAQGNDWRLPTQYELRLLSQGSLASNKHVRSAWSAEVNPEHGASVLRWKEDIPKRLSHPPSMRGRCLTPQPSDLYQRLVATLYPALHQEHRQDSFLRYFYAGEVFTTHRGIRGDLPEAVICVKSTIQADQAAAVHLMKDTILIRDVQSASAILNDLCDKKANASGPCQTLVTQHHEEAIENDPVRLDQEFETRQEKCHQTSNPEVCTEHGWYYRIQGEFDKALLFFDWSCQKGVGNACLEKEQIALDQQRFTKASEKLVRLKLSTTAPVWHREAKEPLILGCTQGEAELCLYRGMIAEWEYKQQDARGYYARGCAAGLLLSCTKEILMERHFTMAMNIDRDITPKFVALCKKKEPLACMQAGNAMMSDRQEQTVRDGGEKLLADACAAGVTGICEYHKEITIPNRVYVRDELEADSIRTASSYDIDRLREQCSGTPSRCRGILNQLSLQGQFKEAEWFARAACNHERGENLQYCYQLIPYRQLFESLSQTLIQKKYIKRQPQDHASALPVIKKACEEGMAQSCSYLGMLMYDSMTGRFDDGSNQLYSLAGLIKPYQNACKFGDTSACKQALDLARDWREGRYSAEKEQSRRPATIEESKAYGQLCEERNYAGACWEVLQPWLEDRRQDHRQVPDHLASAWRYTERLCENGKDTVVCWALLKPWIDSLEHDHSKLPKDRSEIRKQLERICKIEVEEESEDRRACRELQRYIDLHWL